MARIAGIGGRAGHGVLYVSSFVAGLLVWHLISRVLPGVTFASPLDVFAAMSHRVADGSLLRAFASSLLHFAVGLSIAGAIAVPMGLLIGRSDVARRLLSPIINALFAIPSVAFVPFIVIWFGLFFEARVAVVVIMTVFDMIITIAAGARAIDPGVLAAARAFGVRGPRMLAAIYLPASLPFVLTALRVGVVRATNAMITAELFLAAVNLGKIMQSASSNFDIATMMGVVFLVSLFGLAMQQVVGRLESRLVGWARAAS